MQRCKGTTHEAYTIPGTKCPVCEAERRIWLATAKPGGWQKAVEREERGAMPPVEEPIRFKQFRAAMRSPK